jgi:hypothetical protein
MKGYKAFKSDWTCLGFQYEMGQTYHMDANNIELSQSGFHFCQYPSDVFEYYDNEDDCYAEILAEGKIIEGEDKCVTNHITLVKSLTKEQLFECQPNYIIRKNGDQLWYQKGRLHRNEAPAVEEHSGTKKWYQNGKLHRLDGPAIEFHNGTKLWYQNGKLHRLDGPAAEYPNGINRYYIRGISQGSK